MDNYTSGGIGAVVVAVLGLIYRAVNHKRVRSNCCGKKIDASLDIEETTPQPVAKVAVPTTPKPTAAIPVVPASKLDADSKNHLSQ